MGEGDTTLISNVTSHEGDGGCQRDGHVTDSQRTPAGKTFKKKVRRDSRCSDTALQNKDKLQGKVARVPHHCCEICSETFISQFKFFEHLKRHYENESFDSEQFVKEENNADNSKVDSACNRDTAASKTNPSKNCEKDIHKTQDDGTNVGESTAKRNNKDSNQSEIANANLKYAVVHSNKKSLENDQTASIPVSEIHTDKKLLPNSHFNLEENHKILCKIDDGTQLTSAYLDKNEPVKPNEEVSILQDDEPVFDDDDDDLETEQMYLESNICPSCDECCETRENLDEHIRKVHPQLDDRGTGTTPGKNKKSKSKNLKVDSLKCEICAREFSHRNSLVYHRRSHTGVRPYKCELCDKRFFATSALKVHERVHSGSKPYPCLVCGRQFRQWGDLKYHQTSLHSNVKAYQCEYCGKDFARNYSLTVHRRIHTGERNYRCDFCPKTFRAASYLQNHRRIHTGEKPYECHCGKRFRAHSDLKRHTKSHNKTVQIDIDSLEVIQGDRKTGICEVVSITEETSVILPHSTVLPLKADFHNNILASSSATTILSKEPEQICVPFSTITDPHSHLHQASSESTFTVALTSCSETTGSGLMPSSVPEGITLYQDTSQNLDIFGTEGSRTNAVVLFPLSQQFLPDTD